jgi:hypothetical protein
MRKVFTKLEGTCYITIYESHIENEYYSRQKFHRTSGHLRQSVAVTVQRELCRDYFQNSLACTISICC